MRLEHPIFQGPLEPGIELTEVDTPDNYATWPEGRDLPEKLTAWQVQTGEFPEEIDVGLVSDPYGMSQIPDAEWISGGVNSKGPDSMALGRHGNYFLGGFSADPRRMTESAKKVFLNTLVYMQAFDGQKPLVRRQGSGRQMAFALVGILRNHGVDQFVEMAPNFFGAEVWERYADDLDGLEAYYHENLAYLMPRVSGYGVDEDLKQIGFGNEDPALLTAIQARLSENEEDELARRLMKRYLHPEVAGMNAERFQRWLDRWQGRLFFSDIGGFRWYVDTRPERQPR